MRSVFLESRFVWVTWVGDFLIIKPKRLKCHKFWLETGLKLEEKGQRFEKEFSYKFI